MPKRHPRTRFRQAALAATKWCETTQNMSFGPNIVDWKRFGRKSRKKFHWPELVPKRHPRTRFRNGALAATKWCETTQNVSFGPKLVDWMCFRQKTRYTVAKPPKASLHTVHGESTNEEGSQQTTEHDNKQYSSHLQPNSVE